MNAKALKKGKCTGRCGLTGRYSDIGMMQGLYMGYTGVMEKKLEITRIIKTILTVRYSKKRIGPHAWLLWECVWSGGYKQQPS